MKASVIALHDRPTLKSLIAGIFAVSVLIAEAGNVGPRNEATTSTASERSRDIPAKASQVPPGDKPSAANAHWNSENPEGQSKQQLLLERQAANAAQDSANAAWATFYAGLLIGVPTLLSAAAAAYFSGRAARHARENLEAVYESERGILHAQSAIVGRDDVGDAPLICINVFNRGRTTARVIEIGTMDGPKGSVTGSNPRWISIAPGDHEPIPAFPFPESKDPFYLACWIAYRSVGPKIHKSFFTLRVRWSDGNHPSGLASFVPHWSIDVTNSNGHPDDT